MVNTFDDVQPDQPTSLSLEDCLKLLKGERDEQRLAGLFLVTKICKGDDLASLTRIYDAVGTRFLDRLLRTGMGKGSISRPGNENRDAYLQLSVRVLVVFCRVPDIASSDDMVSKIPLILEILTKESGSSILEECFEFLHLVSTASENGVMALYESGGMKVLASRMSMMPDDSHSTKLAVQLIQLIISKMSLDNVIVDYLSELSLIVVTIARRFAILHDATKFEALHLLSAILSTDSMLHDALHVMPDKSWSNCMRDGISAILHNRVAPAEKFQALILAESMISVMGESWLIGEINLPDVQDPIPADRCLLLVLEQSRVEVAVLLNELAYLKYETSKKSSFPAEEIVLKQRNVATVFSLVEKIIKLISNAAENQENLFYENTFTKVLRGLNETIGVVLEYLQDAKEHGQNKGDDLLASVRIIGSYLAETPLACKEKVRELLGYMLSIEGADEQRPFYSICFLLPMLCQITMEVEGCKDLASSGGYKAVAICLIKLIEQDGGGIKDNGCIFLACDTVMNFLLKKEQVGNFLDKSTSVHLVKALSSWAESTDDPSVVMMAASICTLMFDSLSEKDLLHDPSFDGRSLDSLSRLFTKSLSSSWLAMSDDANSQMDLLEIVTAGYSRWAHHFPHVREAVERSALPRE